jgi:hypothetical protein
MPAGLLLAEELLLIAYDDERGRDRSDWGLDAGLAGALLIELADSGHLTQDADHLVPTGAGPAPGGLPGEALAAVAASERPRSAGHWVHRLPRTLEPLRRRVAEGLVARGILREEHARALGVIPVTRFPIREPAVEAALVARLRGVLLEDRPPDARTAQLVALLSGVQLVGLVVPRARRRAARRHAHEIADGDMEAEAVDRAIREVQAAVVAAVETTAATVAAAAASS